MSFRWMHLGVACAIGAAACSLPREWATYATDGVDVRWSDSRVDPASGERRVLGLRVSVSPERRRDEVTLALHVDADRDLEPDDPEHPLSSTSYAFDVRGELEIAELAIPKGEMALLTVGAGDAIRFAGGRG